jgi:hypothetical protein
MVRRFWEEERKVILGSMLPSDASAARTIDQVMNVFLERFEGEDPSPSSDSVTRVEAEEPRKCPVYRELRLLRSGGEQRTTDQKQEEKMQPGDVELFNVDPVADMDVDAAGLVDDGRLITTFDDYNFKQGVDDHFGMPHGFDDDPLQLTFEAGMQE